MKKRAEILSTQAFVLWLDLGQLGNVVETSILKYLVFVYSFNRGNKVFSSASGISKIKVPKKYLGACSLDLRL
jgi:putative transposon-encoded protein